MIIIILYENHAKKIHLRSRRCFKALHENNNVSLKKYFSEILMSNFSIYPRVILRWGFKCSVRRKSLHDTCFLVHHEQHDRMNMHSNGRSAFSLLMNFRSSIIRCLFIARTILVCDYRCIRYTRQSLVRRKHRGKQRKRSPLAEE